MTEKTKPIPSDLLKGEALFFEKKYKEADLVFSSVLRQTIDPVVRNIALYSLACSRIMISEDEKEISNAISIFKKWRPKKEQDRQYENPNMILKTIGHIRRIEKKRLRLKIDQMEKKYSEQIGQIQKSLEQKQGETIEKDNTIKKLIKRSVEMKEVIKTLQDQIKGLEHIDQEIQEKRKAG